MAWIALNFEFELDLRSDSSIFSASTRRDADGRPVDPGFQEFRTILARFEYAVSQLFPDAADVRASAHLRIDSLHGDDGQLGIYFPGLDVVTSQPLVANALPRIADLLAEAIVSVFSSGWNTANVRLGKPRRGRPVDAPQTEMQIWIVEQIYDLNDATALRDIANHSRLFADRNPIRSEKFPKLSGARQILAAHTISIAIQVLFVAAIWWIAQRAQSHERQMLLRDIKELVTDKTAPVVDIKIDLPTPEITSVDGSVQGASDSTSGSDPCANPATIRVFADGSHVECW